MFGTMREIREAAADSAHSHRWFRPETMLFFHSEIEAGPLRGRLFVTSDRRQDNMPKLYTVRSCSDSGEISDVSEFQEFTTLQAALDYVERLPA